MSSSPLKANQAPSLPAFPFLPKRAPALLLIALLIGAARLHAEIASFPGAVGYGGTTTGAWMVSGTNHTGGTVYHVTNLNDSGAGSFRTGVGKSGNIVVFDVGGSIKNLSAVSVASNVSIEGQTAPGGIQVYGAETSFYGSSNIICRYMRFRDGTDDPNYPGANGTNSHTNAVNMGDTTNIILDHCCFEFAAYNNIDSAGAINVTIQNCLFGDPIAEQRFNCHFETGPVTFIGNLWTNSHGRNPLGKGNMQFVNNIVYNYQYAMTTGNSSGNFLWDVINNYFISGPSTTNASDAYYQVDSNQSAYATGNFLDSNSDGKLNGGGDNGVSGAKVLNTYWSPTTTALPTVSAATAFYDVISNAGPLPHDQVDSKIVSDVLSLGKQGMLWTNQNSTGLGNDGYGVISGSQPLPDSDASGMPDDWKAAMGLSLTNPAVAGVTATNGYTNLENYLSWKAAPNAWVAKNTPSQPTSVSIDLSQYANGFASSSTYTVTNVVKGSITQSGAGGHLVNFVPTSGTSGLGGFNWSVNNGITTLTGTAGILISQSAPAQSVNWLGDNATNAWNLTAPVWTSVSTGSAVAFGNGDPVTFADGGSTSPAVNINTVVSPGSITVDTYSSNYTFSGTGAIGGTGALYMEGTGALTIQNTGANTFAGGAVLDSGVVTINSNSALGSGTTTLDGGDLELISSGASLGPGNSINVNSPSTLGIQGGNVTLYGTVSGGGDLALDFNTNNLVTIDGSWAAYTGNLTANGAGSIRFEEDTPWGFPAAALNLAGGVQILNRSGGAVTISIGALNGVSSSSIGGSDQSGANGTICTYSIGALSEPSVFAGSITNGGQIVAITEVGNSTMTLTGSSTYTGNTSVTSGTLVLTGSLGNTDVVVSSGAAFASNSIVSGTVTLNGGAIYLGNSTASAATGTLTVGKNFTVNGGSIYSSLSSSPNATGSNDLITVTGGSLSLNDTINFVIQMTNGVLGAGTYNLINGGAAFGIGNLTMNLVLPIPAGGVTRQSFALVRPASGSTPGYLHLVVTNSAASLTWSGTSGATWNLGTTDDWNPSASGTFFDLDTVTFNDMDGNGTNGAVVLSGTLAPNIAYVSNGLINYTFSGTGGLAGNAVLVKSGTASLTINNTGNTFSGPVYLNAGTLYANAGLGTGTIYLNGGTLALGNNSVENPIVVDASSAITGNSNLSILGNAGATLSSTSPVTLTLNQSYVLTILNDISAFQGTIELGTSTAGFRLVNVGSALALFDLGTATATLGNRDGGVTANFGAIQGGPGTTLTGRMTAQTASSSTYFVGALNTNNTFAGDINNGGDENGLNIVKVGTGIWMLSGSSTFIGDIDVQQGTLAVSGSLNNNGGNFEIESGAALGMAGGVVSTDTVQVDQGAVLTGSGTIDAMLVNQGTVTVTGSGTLIVNGNFENDGTMTIEGGSALAINLPTDGSASFVNTGLLDIMDSPQTALPAGLVNTGTVLTSALVTVRQVARTATTFSTTIQSYTGHTYQLQESPDFVTWQNVGAPQAGTGSVLVLTDTNATSSGMFYRIGVGP